MVDNLSPISLKKQQMKLRSLAQKYQLSVSIQMSSEKILSFLVNDILDYAQISSGKFRKNFSRFNIQECVEEIILVMRFKIEQIGINLKFELQGFEDNSRPVLQNHVCEKQLQVVLDQQRL